YYLERIEREASGEIQTPAPKPFSEQNTNLKECSGAGQGADSSGPPATPPVSTPDPLPKTILVKAGEQVPLSAAERRELEKQRQSLIRRLERREAEILKELEDLESEKTRLEAELARPDVYTSGEKAKAVKLKLDETAAALEEKSREWELRAEELERAKGS
ncbi:MAG: ABC transporter C-terminal domain-containing protein, partial [Treponema sp.]|nr:ABC transporter C-terminal domain-containing protein [Treponema sp.]